jgi:hypothetical protein
MPATVTTKEHFPAGIDEARLKEEVRLRMKAGAIRSWYEKQEGNAGYILYTEWNVIGEQ